MTDELNLTPEQPSQNKDGFFEIVQKFIRRLGDPSKYTFEGEVIDLGAPVGKCTCDHPIRYVFIIKGPNGEEAPVGSECINHFQSYNPDLYQRMLAAQTRFWTKRKEEEKAAKEAEYQKEVAEVKIPYEAALAEARGYIDAFRAAHPGWSWVPNELYSCLLKINAKPPVYKRTKTYVEFYKRETKAIYQLLVKYMNDQAANHPSKEDFFATFVEYEGGKHE